MMYAWNEQTLRMAVEQIEQFAAINGVVELRGLEAPNRRGVCVAYIQPNADIDLERLLRGQSPVNLYISVNRPHEGVICRAPFRWVVGGKMLSGDDIIMRTHLVLDFDPVRPAGIPSSDAEHARALEACMWLLRAIERSFGVRPRFVLDTGNGAQALFPIAQTVAEGNQTQPNALRFLSRALEKRYQDIKLDLATVNPSQLTRLAGTYNQKGYEWGDRRHRVAQLLVVNPDANTVAPVAEWAQAYGAEKVVSEKSTAPSDADPEGLEAVLKRLREAGLTPLPPRPMRDGAWLIPLERCAFNPAHLRGHTNPGVIVSADGRIGYKCFHTDCADRTGRAFREWLESIQTQCTRE